VLEAAGAIDLVGRDLNPHLEPSYGISAVEIRARLVAEPETIDAVSHEADRAAERKPVTSTSSRTDPGPSKARR